MSKLDDILKQAADVIARGLVTDEWKKIDTKQQIKDLMLELVGPDTTSNQFWQHEFNDGYNYAVKGIHQRVEEL